MCDLAPPVLKGARGGRSSRHQGALRSPLGPSGGGRTRCGCGAHRGIVPYPVRVSRICPDNLVGAVGRRAGGGENFFRTAWARSSDHRGSVRVTQMVQQGISDGEVGLFGSL